MKSRADQQQPPPPGRTLVLAAGDRTAALRTGAVLICRDIAEAGRAEATGISRGALLLEAAPQQAAELIRAGWQVIVDADAAGRGPHAAAATAALCAWLGAAAVSTRHVAAVSRAVDMAESIRGTRQVSGGCYARS